MLHYAVPVVLVRGAVGQGCERADMGKLRGPAQARVHVEGCVNQSCEWQRKGLQLRASLGIKTVPVLST